MIPGVVAKAVSPALSNPIKVFLREPLGAEGDRINRCWRRMRAVEAPFEALVRYLREKREAIALRFDGEFGRDVNRVRAFDDAEVVAGPG